MVGYYPWLFSVQCTSTTPCSILVVPFNTELYGCTVIYLFFSLVIVLYLMLNYLLAVSEVDTS